MLADQERRLPVRSEPLCPEPSLPLTGAWATELQQGEICEGLRKRLKQKTWLR